MPQAKIIDNERKILADVLNESLDDFQDISIATGYWDLKGTGLLLEKLEKYKTIRLLIGREPLIPRHQLKHPEPDYPERDIFKDLESLVYDEQLKANIIKLKELKEKGVLQVRIYKKSFLHAKCYILGNEKSPNALGIIGSSNFTGNGLTQNTELNSLESDHRIVLFNPKTEEQEVGHLFSFNQFWAESEEWDGRFIELLEQSPVGDVMDTSAFVKNNLKTKLEKGEYPGWVPYGYLNIGENGVITGRRFDKDKQTLLEELNRPLKRVEIDPIEGPFIRKLLDLALTGVYDLRMLQEEASKLGIKGKNSGKKLAKESVRGILKNRFYSGKFNYLGEVRQGSHEPLMSMSEFERLQVILNKRSRPKRYKHDYTYSTRVHCPECSRLMSGEFQKGMHYYRCAKAKGKEATCSYKTHIRQDALDKQMVSILKRLTVPPRMMDWLLKLLKISYLQENKFLSGKRVLLQKNINDEKHKLERLTSKWLSDANVDGGLLSDDDYKERKTGIQKNADLYKEQLNDNDGEEDNWLAKCEQFFKKIRNVDIQYEEGDVIEKQMILQWMGAKFIRKDEVMTIELDEPFNSYLNPKKATSSIRTLEGACVSEKLDLTPERQIWLPGSDSNRRPID